jgi:hypothetical protein
MLAGIEEEWPEHVFAGNFDFVTHWTLTIQSF